MSLDTNTLNSLRIDRSAQNQPKTKKLPVKMILIITALLFILGAWFFTREKPPHQPIEQIAAVKNISPSIKKESAILLDASGYVTARRQAKVAAKVTGKIDRIFIEEGMTVKSGQLLAQLDDSNISKQVELSRHQVASAQSDLKQIRIRLNEAQRTAHRAQQLNHNNLISAADLDAAHSAVAVLQAQAETAKNQIAVAQTNEKIQQQNAEDLFIRAPFSGVIISKDAQPGEMVSPLANTGSSIATIVDMNSLEIEVDVNESFIHRVQEKQKTEAILDAYPDWIIPSHVISIVPTADRQKATVRVRVGFDALDKRILPDMGVKVRFLDNTP